MTQKDQLLDTIEFLDYSSDDPYNNMTHALRGLVEATQGDEKLLGLVEKVVANSVALTKSSVDVGQLKESLQD